MNSPLRFCGWGSFPKFIPSATLMLVIFPVCVTAQELVNREAAFTQWVETRPMKLLRQYESRLKELNLETTESIPLFVSRLDAKEIKVRRAAALGLRLIGSQDPAKATPALLQAAQDADQEVRNDAIAGLGEIEPPTATTIAVIAEALENDERDGYIAARALGRFGARAKPAIDSLIGSLDSDRLLTRSCAAEALGNIGPDAQKAAPALRAKWRDEDPDVRLKAAIASWKVDESHDAIKVITESLETRDSYSLVMRATQVLGEIGKPARGAIPTLKIFQQEDDGIIATAATWAIGKIRGDKNLLDQLISKLDSQNALTRVGAAWALGHMGPEARKAVPKLKELFDEKSQSEYGFGILYIVESIETLEAEGADRQ